MESMAIFPAIKMRIQLAIKLWHLIESSFCLTSLIDTCDLMSQSMCRFISGTHYQSLPLVIAITQSPRRAVQSIQVSAELTHNWNRSQTHVYNRIVRSTDDSIPQLVFKSLYILHRLQNRIRILNTESNQTNKITRDMCAMRPRLPAVNTIKHNKYYQPIGHYLNQIVDKRRAVCHRWKFGAQRRLCHSICSVGRDRHHWHFTDWFDVWFSWSPVCLPTEKSIPKMFRFFYSWVTLLYNPLVTSLMTGVLGFAVVLHSALRLDLNSGSVNEANGSDENKCLSRMRDSESAVTVVLV